MFYVKKKMEIAGSHSLRLSYESKCANVHGHNWVVTVYCRAAVLNEDGMVCDFTRIKERIHGALDHRHLFNPTAENLARWITEQVPQCYMAKVMESEGNTAVYSVDDVPFEF